MCSRSCSTRSTISTTRRPGSFRRGQRQPRLSQRHAGKLARCDLAQVGSGGPKLDDVLAGEGAALLPRSRPCRATSRLEILDIDLKTAPAAPSRPGCSTRSRSAPTARPARARSQPLSDGGIDPQRAAEVRFMRFFRIRRWRSRPSTSRDGSWINALRAPVQPAFKGEIPATGRSRGRRRARPGHARSRDPAGRGRRGEIAPVDAALAGLVSLRELLRHRDRG